MLLRGEKGLVLGCRHQPLNSDPYGKGWMVLIDLSNAGEVEGLMTAAQYEAFLSTQKH